MIFGSSNPEEILHQDLVDLSTLPVSCRHFTLGNPKKNHFSKLLIRTSDYICYLRIKRTVTAVPWLHLTDDVRKSV